MPTKTLPFLALLALGAAVPAALSAGLFPSGAPDGADAGMPCPNPPHEILRRDLGRLGKAGPAELRFEFKMKKSGSVWAEFAGLNGLSASERAAAPEAFLDDTYIGPLVAGRGAFWRSPQAYPLEPGGHVLLLRRALQASGVPLQHWEAMRIMAGDPCPPAPDVFAQQEEAPAPPCSNLRQRADWPEKLKAGVVLSVLNGHLVPSGVLVKLRDGEEWSALVKLPGGADGGELPFFARFDPQQKKGVRFEVGWDRGFPTGKRLGYYTPGKWEPMTAILCGGNLRIKFARMPSANFPWIGDSAEVEVAAQDIELSIAPAKSQNVDTAAPTPAAASGADAAPAVPAAPGADQAPPVPPAP